MSLLSVLIFSLIFLSHLCSVRSQKHFLRAVPSNCSAPADLLVLVQQKRDSVIPTIKTQVSNLVVREEVSLFQQADLVRKELLRLRPCNKLGTPQWARINSLIDEVNIVVNQYARTVCSLLPEFELKIEQSRQIVAEQFALLVPNITKETFDKILLNITSERKFFNFFAVCYDRSKFIAGLPQTQIEADTLIRQAKYLLLRTYISAVAKRVTQLNDFFSGKWKLEFQENLQKSQSLYRTRIQQLESLVTRMKQDQEEKALKLKREREERERLEREKREKLEREKIKKQDAKLQKEIVKQQQQLSQLAKDRAETEADLSVTQPANDPSSASSTPSSSLSSSISIALIVIGSIILILLVVVQVQLIRLYRQNRGKQVERQ